MCRRLLIEVFSIRIRLIEVVTLPSPRVQDPNVSPPQLIRTQGDTASRCIQWTALLIVAILTSSRLLYHFKTWFWGKREFKLFTGRCHLLCCSPLSSPASSPASPAPTIPSLPHLSAARRHESVHSTRQTLITDAVPIVSME